MEAPIEFKQYMSPWLDASDYRRLTIDAHEVESIGQEFPACGYRPCVTAITTDTQAYVVEGTHDEILSRVQEACSQRAKSQLGVRWVTGDE